MNSTYTANCFCAIELNGVDTIFTSSPIAIAYEIRITRNEREREREGERESSKKQWHVNNINGTWQKPNYKKSIGWDRSQPQFNFYIWFTSKFVGDDTIHEFSIISVGWSASVTIHFNCGQIKCCVCYSFGSEFLRVDLDRCGNGVKFSMYTSLPFFSLSFLFCHWFRSDHVINRYFLVQ